jgi:hypothetical protein
VGSPSSHGTTFLCSDTSFSAGGLVPTPVVDLTVAPPVVIREGAGPVEEIVEDAPRSLRDVRAAMQQLKDSMRD